MFILEFAHPKKKKTINMVGAIFDSSGVILVALYFYFIKDGESAFYVYIITTLGLLICLIKIPETPSFLYSKRKWVQLRQCFAQISSINKGETLTSKFDKEEHFEEEDHHEESSLKHLLCDDRTRTINLIIMIFNW